MRERERGWLAGWLGDGDLFFAHLDWYIEGAVWDVQVPDDEN